ncbi:MAG: ferredoxin family protein [Syntrophomonadaceae bacterium]|nr:ferredoxin family protein [Syntrophomonadaceae bacterium]
MSITIDRNKCTGCGKCRDVCPGNLLYSDSEGRTYIKYPRDCWGCTSCIKECSFSVLRYYLGADIGGRGGYLHTISEENLIHWVFNSPDGGKKILTVDRNKANKY